MDGGGGCGGPLCGDRLLLLVVVVVVCVGFKSRKAKRDASGLCVRPCSLVDERWRRWK